MKTNRILGTIFFIALLAFPALVSLRSGAESTAGADKEAEALKLISGYTKWSKANNSPAFLYSLGDLCAATPSQQVLKREANDPHIQKFITVYVNDVGHDELMNRKSPHYPEGTVIVKEKLSAATNTMPDLLTVMVKRKAGFDKQHGDWEYLAFNGAGTREISKGLVHHCQECHEDVKLDDYVYRSYLPANVLNSLK